MASSGLGVVKEKSKSLDASRARLKLLSQKRKLVILQNLQLLENKKQLKLGGSTHNAEINDSRCFSQKETKSEIDKDNEKRKVSVPTSQYSTSRMDLPERGKEEVPSLKRGRDRNTRMELEESSHSRSVRKKALLLPDGQGKYRKCRNSKSEILCSYFHFSGRCKRGRSCNFRHDPKKRRLCPHWLRQSCRMCDACPLRHELDASQMPACLHYLRGKCEKKSCIYAHVKVGRDAKACEHFQRGYCPRGLDCTEKHVWKRIEPKIIETLESHKAVLNSDSDVEARDKGFVLRTKPSFLGTRSRSTSEPGAVLRGVSQLLTHTKP
eukprot:CAMPEP_0184480808 /NCGR_PEP_ID=MMETSP0113_2-20130426/2321_1 /TAXON_ID=91329 /ORGANISM="Norrisiella sphaerica, Strain BC52" /LENGTH=322 /DNA_ID=CAMNT_0026859533 /DNA_START=13 /DNA_END=977 /DNA_ORIENTATION=-